MRRRFPPACGRIRYSSSTSSGSGDSVGSHVRRTGAVDHRRVWRRRCVPAAGADRLGREGHRKATTHLAGRRETEVRRHAATDRDRRAVERERRHPRVDRRLEQSTAPRRVVSELAAHPTGDRDRPIEVLWPQDLDVDRRDRVDAGQVRREANEPVRDRVERAQPVTERRTAQADLLDLTFGARSRGGLHGDPVAFVERALDEDQDPHQVVEHDRLPGEREGRGDQPETGEQLPEVEHAEDQDDQGDKEAGADQFPEDDLERLRPFSLLFGRVAPRLERRALDLEQSNDHSVRHAHGKAIEGEQDQAAHDQGEPVGKDPAEKFVEGHLGASMIGPPPFRRNHPPRCSNGSR